MTHSDDARQVGQAAMGGPPASVGNGNSGGGGECHIIIGFVEHSHLFRTHPEVLPLPIHFEFRLNEPVEGAERDGTVTVQVGTVRHSHTFRPNEDVNFSFNFKTPTPTHE